MSVEARVISAIHLLVTKHLEINTWCLRTIEDERGSNDGRYFQNLENTLKPWKYSF